MSSLDGRVGRQAFSIFLFTDAHDRKRDLGALWLRSLTTLYNATLVHHRQTNGMRLPAAQVSKKPWTRRANLPVQGATTHQQMTTGSTSGNAIADVKMLADMAMVRAVPTLSS
jgi:hypothetical protein